MSEDQTKPQAGDAEAHRTGQCVLLGLPNVGKSTLLNQILGRRLLAVSAKPQTTRNRILGVKNVEGARPAQIVFVDTPGMQTGKGALRRFMRDEAMSAAETADVRVVVVDATESRQRDPRHLMGESGHGLGKALSDGAAPVLLALNKVDAIGAKSTILPILEAYGKSPLFAEIIPISGKSGDGVERLLSSIVSRLATGEALFPKDMVTDRAERFLASELIREQLFNQLGKELPYASAVIVESFEDRDVADDVVISAVVYVERDSQKRIVIGHGGQQIKAVGIAARQALSELFRCPVHLKLHVKVHKDWSQGPGGIRQMGYDS